ncbi:MAG: YceD family protein [Bilophila wadsworthia]
MAELRIALNNIAPEGKTFVMDDPAIWSVPMTECGMDCRVVQPLVGTVTLLPQEDGCLVRGNLRGEVVVPCNRCAEDAHLIIDSSFDSFEPFPQADDETEPQRQRKAVRQRGRRAHRQAGGRRAEDQSGRPALEEFVLALRYVLCASLIAGLCPDCGKNLNEGSCSCVRDEGDPRLAASGV